MFRRCEGTPPSKCSLLLTSLSVKSPPALITVSQSITRTGCQDRSVAANTGGDNNEATVSLYHSRLFGAAGICQMEQQRGAIRWTSGFTVVSGCYRSSTAKCDKEDKVLQATSWPRHLWVQHEKTEARRLRGCLKIDPLKKKAYDQEERIVLPCSRQARGQDWSVGPNWIDIVWRGSVQTRLCILVSRLHMCPIN